jgi:protein SCO1
VTSPAARPWHRSALLALGAVLLLLGSVWVYARLQSPYPYYGTVYTETRMAPVFSGQGADGQPYTFRPGRTTALFFGFTHCPDVCPLSLGYLEQVRRRLTPAQQAGFDIVLVSLDPERDTPAALARYTAYFGHARGVQVPEPALGQLAAGYGVSYVKAPLTERGRVTPTSYQINHTAATYLIDRAGRVRLLWDVSQLGQPDRVAADVQQVMGP